MSNKNKIIIKKPAIKQAFSYKRGKNYKLSTLASITDCIAPDTFDNKS